MRIFGIIKETKPSISHSEKIKLTKIYKEFVNDRDGNMPDGPQVMKLEEELH